MYWFLILTPGIIYLHYLCSLHFHLSAHLALSHSHTCILSCIFHFSSLQTLLNLVPKRGWDQSSGVTPTTNLTTLSRSSYMSCTDTTYFNSFQIPLSLLINWHPMCGVYAHLNSMSCLRFSPSNLWSCLMLFYGGTYKLQNAYKFQNT